MRRNGWGDNLDKLLAYFERNLEVLYRKRNKRSIFWQELLLNQNEYIIPKDAIVHTWQVQSDLIKVVKRGYKTLLSAGWYLDYQMPTGGQRRLMWLYTWIDFYLNDLYVGYNFNEEEKKINTWR